MNGWRVTRFGSPADAEFVNLPDPTVGADELLIDVEAASVNFPDILMMQGLYQVRPALPFVPGRDAAGIVVRTGAKVSGFRVGDRVCAMAVHGAFADRLAVSASRCFPVPDRLSLEAAAAGITTYATAHVALVVRAALGPGETVLVLGAAGGVGTAALHYARYLGARVIACVSTEEKAQHVQAAGAAPVIVGDLTSANDTLRSEVHRITGGRGVDVVIDPVGGVLFQAALRCLAPKGRHVVVGFASGQIGEVKAGYVLIKDIAVVGSSLERCLVEEPSVVRNAMEKIFSLLADGRLDPGISALFHLSDAQAAFSAILDRRAKGKIVLRCKELRG
jgi:NADPH2:quinone reductase